MLSHYVYKLISKGGQYRWIHLGNQPTLKGAESLFALPSRDSEGYAIVCRDTRPGMERSNPF